MKRANVDAGAGKWVPLEEYALRMGVSKGTVYRRIRRGELIKRLVKSRTEVFVAGEDAPLFEDITSSPPSERDVMSMDIELPDGDYGIAAQSLRTLLAMYKEVIAEKHRMLAEWENELAQREQRLTELEAAVAERDDKLADKVAEIRQLRRALQMAEATTSRLETELAEVRTTLKQLETLEENAEHDWKRMEELLEEKSRLLKAKDEVISGMESAVGQKDEALATAERTIGELRKSLEETRALLKEKEEIIRRLSAEPADLDGKLAARNQQIGELKSLVRALESQLESAAKAKELTGFSEEGAPTTTLIQDQLEYLMTSEDSRKYLEDAEAIPPEEAGDAGGGETKN